jgi:hypothetical protein
MSIAATLVVSGVLDAALADVLTVAPALWPEPTAEQARLAHAIHRRR